ncbi:MAG: peptidoglycan-binding protein [Actinobacteria bacterium]|nr:peptidoglycan-binding protein [Actinomycetota bacterium]
MTTLKRRRLKIVFVSILSLVMTFSINLPSNAFANIIISTEIPDYPGKDKLKAGVKNSSVKKVQEALIELGYEISSANGKYGPSTTKAIKAFYKDLGDNDDGTSLGKVGWKKLFEALDEQREEEKAAVQELLIDQKRLRLLNYQKQRRK